MVQVAQVSKGSQVSQVSQMCLGKRKKIYHTYSIDHICKGAVNFKGK